MDNNDYIEQIHRFLQNEMEAPERKKFQAEMEKNEVLRNDVLIEGKLLLGLGLMGDEDLRNTIQSVEKDMEQKGFFEKKDNIIPIHSNKKKSIMNRMIAFAAAAVILIGVAWWGFFRQPAVDTNAAYAQYFKPEKSKLNEIMGGFSHAFADTVYNYQDSLEDALKLYEAGQYNEACAALDSILLRHPANDTAQFYLAMGHLNAERYARAIEILSNFSSDQSSPFYFDAKWYLGLSYLKADKGLSKAKEIFTALSDDAAFKDRQSAKGLLRMLGN
ncbi:MAG: hypothetical protein R2830_00935 [Saprospiraceae bacterium]